MLGRYVVQYIYRNVNILDATRVIEPVNIVFPKKSGRTVRRDVIHGAIFPRAHKVLPKNHTVICTGLTYQLFALYITVVLCQRKLSHNIHNPGRLFIFIQRYETYTYKFYTVQQGAGRICYPYVFICTVLFIHDVTQHFFQILLFLVRQVLYKPFNMHTRLVICTIMPQTVIFIYENTYGRVDRHVPWIIHCGTWWRGTLAFPVVCVRAPLHGPYGLYHSRTVIQNLGRLVYFSVFEGPWLLWRLGLCFGGGRGHIFLYLYTTDRHLFLIVLFFIFIILLMYYFGLRKMFVYIIRTKSALVTFFILEVVYSSLGAACLVQGIQGVIFYARLYGCLDLFYVYLPHLMLYHVAYRTAYIGKRVLVVNFFYVVFACYFNLGGFLRTIYGFVYVYGPLMRKPSFIVYGCNGKPFILKQPSPLVGPSCVTIKYVIQSLLCKQGLLFTICIFVRFVFCKFGVTITCISYILTKYFIRSMVYTSCGFFLIPSSPPHPQAFFLQIHVLQTRQLRTIRPIFTGIYFIIQFFLRYYLGRSTSYHGFILIFSLLGSPWLVHTDAAVNTGHCTSIFIHGVQQNLCQKYLGVVLHAMPLYPILVDIFFASLPKIITNPLFRILRYLFYYTTILLHHFLQKKGHVCIQRAIRLHSMYGIRTKFFIFLRAIYAIQNIRIHVHHSIQLRYRIVFLLLFIIFDAIHERQADIYGYIGKLFHVHKLSKVDIRAGLHGFLPNTNTKLTITIADVAHICRTVLLYTMGQLFATNFAKVRVYMPLVVFFLLVYSCKFHYLGSHGVVRCFCRLQLYMHVHMGAKQLIPAGFTYIPIGGIVFFLVQYTNTFYYFYCLSVLQARTQLFYQLAMCTCVFFLEFPLFFIVYVFCCIMFCLLFPTGFIVFLQNAVTVIHLTLHCTNFTYTIRLHPTYFFLHIFTILSRLGTVLHVLHVHLLQNHLLLFTLFSMLQKLLFYRVPEHFQIPRSIYVIQQGHVSRCIHRGHCVHRTQLFYKKYHALIVLLRFILLGFNNITYMSALFLTVYLSVYHLLCYPIIVPAMPAAPQKLIQFDILVRILDVVFLGGYDNPFPVFFPGFLVHAFHIYSNTIGQIGSCGDVPQGFRREGAYLSHTHTALRGKSFYPQLMSIHFNGRFCGNGQVRSIIYKNFFACATANTYFLFFFTHNGDHIGVYQQLSYVRLHGHGYIGQLCLLGANMVHKIFYSAKKVYYTYVFYIITPFMGGVHFIHYCLDFLIIVRYDICATVDYLRDRIYFL
ncbi:pM1249L [African swine fever virus]|uniref:PM1249L n=1 Tax=African swine fever virus TaxID=10497 RepID=A0A894KSM6_ASF|nr:pM1249L [African swine fever virus]